MIKKIVIISLVLVAVSFVVPSPNTMAGSQQIQQQIDTTIYEQRMKLKKLKQRLDGIQDLIKPIKIPKDVRINRKK